MPGGFSSLRPHGEAQWASVEADRSIVRDCLQCCHCGAHFYVTPGSGKRRGFCMGCNQVTCGQEKCDPCIHWKKKFELIEAGKAPMSLISTGKAEGLPVSASVPAAPPTKVILGRG